MDEPPIRVDVLTGFLGSGKTTLIRRLMDAGALADTAFLINEFADLPLDAMLLDGAGAGLAVLAGNCICCAVDSDIRTALEDLLDKRDSGVVPPFRRILVETSGIAEPAPVLATVMNDAFLEARLAPGRVLVCADALNTPANLAEFPAAVAQIAAGDALILTKTDLAGQDAMNAIGRELSWLNPLAVQLDGKQETAALAAALESVRAVHGIEAMPARPIGRSERDRPDGASHGAQACRILWPEPVDWPAFSLWLSSLLHRHGDSILRVKGLMRLKGDGAEPDAILVQAVRHAVHPPEHLPFVHAPEGAEIVIIADGLDPALLRRSFALFQRL